MVWVCLDQLWYSYIDIKEELQRRIWGGFEFRKMKNIYKQALVTVVGTSFSCALYEARQKQQNNAVSLSIFRIFFIDCPKPLRGLGLGQPQREVLCRYLKNDSKSIMMIVSYFSCSLYLNIPVMDKSDNNPSHYDPRFYYIQINSLQFHSKPLEDVVLLFKLGGKTSESIYEAEDIVASENDGFKLTEEEAAREVHVLKYGAEQFLNIYLKEGTKVIGYSRVLLSPIFELPHVKHQINAVIYEHIFQSDENKHQVGEAALLNFDIYFQFNFSGILEIIPVSAHLQRNLAQIGEMRPKVRLNFEGQDWCSLPAEGGIHPHWTGHFHTNKSNGGFIASIQDNLRSNKLEEWARLLRMASNRLGFQREEDLKRTAMRNDKGENVPYFDCTEFRMQSAGSHLQVEITTDPFIGSKPELVGTARIRVEDAGFLKHPRKASEKFFEEKMVNLLYNSMGEQLPAGVLKLYVRFVFDPEKVTSQNFSKCDLD